MLTALARLYKDMVEKKMYLTYGIGSIHQWEGFGEAYDLPNESAYCETCASIGLVYLTHRLLKWDWDTLARHDLNPGEIAEVLEGAMYNAVGAGVSIDGKSFFYVNPLETMGASTKRRDWFDPSCCPPNVARLFCSLGEYPFLVKQWKVDGEWKATVAIVLYMNCTGEIDLDGEKVKVTVRTGWPMKGKVEVQFENAQNVEIELRLRIPSWANVSNSHKPRADVDLHSRRWIPALRTQEIYNRDCIFRHPLHSNISPTKPTRPSKHRSHRHPTRPTDLRNGIRGQLIQPL